jgi:hypothetical protein
MGENLKNVWAEFSTLSLVGEYLYLSLCFNKSVFNWTFCQSLYSRKNPIAQKIIGGSLPVIISEYIEFIWKGLSWTNDLAYLSKNGEEDKSYPTLFNVVINAARK